MENGKPRSPGVNLRGLPCQLKVLCFFWSLLLEFEEFCGEGSAETGSCTMRGRLEEAGKGRRSSA